MLLAGLANASIIITSPCSALEFPNTGPSTSSTCSLTADPGFFISSVTVTITSDYTGYVNGNPVVTDVYAFVSNSAGFGAIPNGVVTTNVSNSNPVQNFNSTLTGNFGSTVTESFSMTNTVSGGAVIATSGLMTISGLESPNPVVPEPATLGLVGSALLGLSLVLRRKRS